MFTYTMSIFLTSTAFVSTKAKCGIPLSRYTVFFRTVLKSNTLTLRGFLSVFKKQKTLDNRWLICYNNSS